MRTNESKPVFKNVGVAYDPPDSGSTARAKRVIRTYYCRFTGQTKKLIKQVYSNYDKATNTYTVRTSILERSPVRPTDSCGFHTKEEKRAEARERDEAWAKLSLAEQVAVLDRRLGKGVGARKQRAKLARLAQIQSQVKPVVSNNTNTNQPVVVNQKLTPVEKSQRQVAHAQQAALNKIQTSGRRAK